LKVTQNAYVRLGSEETPRTADKKGIRLVVNEWSSMQWPKLCLDQGTATERAAAQAEIENQQSAMLVYIWLMHCENDPCTSIVMLLQTKHKKELEALKSIDNAGSIHEVTGILAPLASDWADLTL
jgi:hypothetical protein